MSVSIYDIAKKAQVSPSTVSRALQDHPRIGEKTRGRIKTLAKEMGYVPSVVAKSLSANKTWTLGIVIPSVADPFMADVVNGAEEAAQEAGYSIFLSSSRRDPQREMTVVETFYRRRVDAIVIVSSHLGSAYSELDRLNIPIVLIGNQENGEYYHTISEDSVGGMFAAATYLLELGHRRIGFVGAANRPRSSEERFLGYKTALENANIPVLPELVSWPDCYDDFERGRVGLAEIVSSEPTAVICYNDRTAIGLIKACEPYDIDVPADLSVVGFDDIRLAPYLRPALTTVRQPGTELGQLAIQMALDLLDDKQVENQVLSCDLVVRQSTKKKMRSTV